jgi:hypothetical protein
MAKLKHATAITAKRACPTAVRWLQTPQALNDILRLPIIGVTFFCTK